MRLPERRERLMMLSRTEGNVGDLGDRAALDHDLAVEAAVASIKWQSQCEETGAGEYRESHLCKDCEEEISQARLKVLPAATRCVRCQERYEMSHRPRGFLVGFS